MLSLTIKELLSLYKTNTIQPSEVCELCLRRAKTTHQLNAFTLLSEEIALKQAENADKRYLNNCPKSSLDGIPVAVKDNFCTDGLRTTCGSRMLADFVPKYNATVVQRLFDAGAVMMGKTNLDEFAMGTGTVNSIFGPTKNVWQSGIKYTLTDCPVTVNESLPSAKGALRKASPSFGVRQLHHTTNTSRDQWHVAGGSSGGSVVSVASGACFAALASDTGGSTRNPAAFCGVVGLKPTYGLVSRHGLIPLVNSLDVPGIVTRCVEDSALVLNILSGHDPKDSTTVAEDCPKVLVPEHPSVEGLHIGIPREYHCPGMSAEVLDAWSGVADLLEEAGAKMDSVSLPHTQYSVACYSVINQCEVASNMARYDGIEFGLRADTNESTEALFAASRSQGFGEAVRGRILAGNYFLLNRNYKDYFVQALNVRRCIADDFKAVWNKGIDILLTPVTLTDAPTYSQFTSVDNREQCAIQDYFTQPVNMAGLPAITIPICLSSRELPISLQLIAPRFQEEKMLRVAKWIEQRVNFPRMNILDADLTGS